MESEILLLANILGPHHGPYPLESKVETYPGGDADHADHEGMVICKVKFRNLPTDTYGRGIIRVCKINGSVLGSTETTEWIKLNEGELLGPTDIPRISLLLEGLPSDTLLVLADIEYAYQIHAIGNRSFGTLNSSTEIAENFDLSIQHAEKDVTFHCPFGQNVSCSSFILYGCSSVFRARMDAGGTKEIEEVEFSREVVSAMVLYLHNRYLKQLSRDMVVNVKGCAEKYDITRLIEYTEQLLS